jgi:hypothetical protein
MGNLHPKLIEKLKEIRATYPNVNGYSEDLKDEIAGGKKTGRKAIRVYVEKKIPTSQLAIFQTIPDEIEWMIDMGDGKFKMTTPVDIVEIGHQKIRSAPPFQDPTKAFRPLIGGISVGHYEITAGTIDYFVKDASGHIGILSNNHVLANENNASIGDPILQPGAYDGGTLLTSQVAKLTNFIPIQYDNAQPSNCPNATFISGVYNGLAKELKRKTRLHPIVHQLASNLVDCAWATLNDQTNFKPEENGLFSPAGISAAIDGDIVTKTGRTTGVTSGQVIDIAGTITVSYSGSNEATFVEQVITQDTTTPFSAGGDSGSLIMRQSDQMAVALLFAGGGNTTIGNHISDVLTALDITFV